MRTFTAEDGQSVQIDGITFTIIEVGEDEVLVRIEGYEDRPVELVGAGLAVQSEWRAD